MKSQRESKYTIFNHTYVDFYSKNKFKRSVAKKRQKEKLIRDKDRVERYGENYEQPYPPYNPQHNSEHNQDSVNNPNPNTDEIQDNPMEENKTHHKESRNQEFDRDYQKKRTQKAVQKRGKFEDITKMDMNWMDNAEGEILKRNVISAENFSELPIDERLKKILLSNTYDKMTNIQKESIPVVLQNSNVLIKAETGSGKTLAYAVPLIQYLIDISEKYEKITREHGTYAIVFSPTRELCIQIENTIKRLLNPFFHHINPGSLMGGEQPKKEKSRIRKGINILVCTPGRLLYHLKNTSSLNFERLQYLIFDESDRILDMGFEREMTECLQSIKHKCPQIFIKDQPEDSYIVSKSCKVNLVSATLGDKINTLSTKLMRNEIRVGFENNEEKKIRNEEEGTTEDRVVSKLHINSENIIDLSNTIPDSINQFYMKVANHKFKWLYLLAFLAFHQDQKIIVFLSTCD